MSRGFHISEIWCLDGAMYAAAEGCSIKVNQEAYEVEYTTPIEAEVLLDSEQTSMSQISVTVVLPVEDVVGVVFGPEMRS